MELGGNWKVATINGKVTMIITKVATIENLEQHIKNGRID
jgi:hypothetical protein